ncbi:unnamed protein product [Dicrocoelium dendriticum]|nr:unnamed protein product [Dicrocoelium dendriticum]
MPRLIIPWATCDRNIRDMLALPNLHCLRMYSTRVTDAGWIDARQRLNPTNHSQLTLRELNASGRRSSLTTSDKNAIVLIRLYLRTAHLMEGVEPKFPPFGTSPLLGR